MGEKIHLTLLNYLPVLGFGMYALLTGFSDDLFLPLLLSGWIVVVIFQTILTAVYTPPKHASLAIIFVVLPLFLLLVNAWYFNIDYATVFIEMAAIDLLGVIAALNYAFIHKAAKDGLKDAPVFAIVFTIGIISTAGFFLVKLMLRFLADQNYQILLIILLSVSVIRSVLFFAGRLTTRLRTIGSSSKNSTIAQRGEFSAVAILISVGLWLIVVPLLVWIKSLIIPYQ
ncbi:MAG: hypothetical protein IPM74_04245 [Crocinitomicaceae bacterium]|nr:hypothetical protein [Crocinitomicaceae bacterium]MBK8925119.1 hypothetical protein [Crocinitomicaceae bacterium]